MYVQVKKTQSRQLSGNLMQTFVISHLSKFDDVKVYIRDEACKPTYRLFHHGQAGIKNAKPFTVKGLRIKSA
jgi:hypothetical protein